MKSIFKVKSGWSRRSAIVVLVLLSCASACNASTTAVFPDGFLRYPPYNAFDFEATRLVPVSEGALTNFEMSDSDMRYIDAGARWISYADYEKKEAQADYDGVEPNLRSEVQSMRAAPDGDAAYATGKSLPVAIRLYIAGALDFHVAHPAKVNASQDGSVQGARPALAVAMNAAQRVALNRAIFRFQAIVQLPVAEANYRDVAAAYMLGKSLVLRGSPGDEVKAQSAFVLCRDLAKRGMRDPLGLAVSSFGEQARLERGLGDIPSAVALYAEQASYQSSQGVASLKWVAQALYADPTSMAKAEHHPLVQRLLVDYALAINDNGILEDFIYKDYSTPSTHRHASPALYNVAGIGPILAAAKSWPLNEVAAPDHLAALAYRFNDLVFARKLLARQNSALAWWLRSKLSLAGGDRPSAERALLAARKLTASDSFQNASSGLSSFNAEGICHELIQLERARSEFQLALSNSLACDRQAIYVDNMGELSYIANGILTTAEEIAFVNSHTKGDQKDGAGDGLRSELATRLVREGHLHQALEYAEHYGAAYTDAAGTDGPEKPRSQYDLLQEYVGAQDQIKSGGSQVKRAQAWYVSAVLTRVHFDSIFGGDSYAGEHAAAGYPFPAVSPAEKNRVRAGAQKQHQRDTHWYIAYDDALEAAKLVQPRSQAYAAILCHAAHWMHQAPAVGGHKPAAAFAATYRLYIKNGAYVPWGKTFGQVCPQPDFQERKGQIHFPLFGYEPDAFMR